ncbi:hypothetical protein [Palaeococcus ferrophilus]|uniref:hypothetical protein n=1 Tax=Palaeococcus ferrophilus TaxID=83868 RepID=UPI00064EF088|nr:hypothetical protein [Palaeococcus ferrophilus]
MKRTLMTLVVLMLLGSVISAGCIGGGGETTSSSAVPSTTETPSWSTSSTHTTTTSTPSGPTTTTHTTATGTPIPTTTTSTTTTTTTTATPTPTTTTTTTPTEEAYWEHPWEYAPINLGGESYLITYYKYDYKVQPNQSSPVYEYIIEKSVEKTKVHVYGQDMQMNKVDLGEQEVYAYTTVVTPVKAENMDDKLTITVWFVSNNSEAFLYPWDIMWMSYVSPMGSGGDFVGMKFEYKGGSFLFMNPAPFQGGLFPYFEGDQDTFEELNDDLVNLYIGWLATLHMGVWYSWENTNVLVPQSGVWTDGQGHSWQWSTKPDGSATYDGKSFKLVDFQWSYEGTVEGVKLQGSGKFSPYLPLLVEGDGHYSYKDEDSGKTTVIYAYLKLEDLKLEKVSG